MPGIYDELRQRGFVYQCTDEAALEDLLGREGVTFYVGFDPTADSLHAGSLIPLLAMLHLQRAGHRPIALTGGGTAMVGDPSGKTEMRQMLFEEHIRSNAVALARQIACFLELDGVRGLALDNAAWLRDLNYIDFLREIGRHFSVNRMLAAQSYRQRLETGLSFLEFNYMLLQSYDFLLLFRKHGCVLQLGGQDQWGNIVAGMDLVRRMDGAQVHGLTFPLLTDASGNKLGKTVAGAVWLSADRTSPFEFYQYWRNVDDADVGRFLRLFTFLPVEECDRLAALLPPLLNRAKEILAFEVTCFVHGREAAAEVYRSALRLFPPADPGATVPTSSSILACAGETEQAVPLVAVSPEEAEQGIAVLELLVRAGLCASRGEARRLVRQGGVRLDDSAVADEASVMGAAQLAGSPVLKAGKKRMVRIVVR